VQKGTRRLPIWLRPLVEDLSDRKHRDPIASQTLTIIISSVLEILQHAIECCLVRVVASFAKFKAQTLPFVPRVQVLFRRAVAVGALGCIATECKLCSSRKLSQSTGFTFP